MLVKGDISGVVFDKRKGILGCRAFNENNITLSNQINSGLVVITKEYLNDSTFKHIMQYCKRGFNLPDQKCINRFFGNKIKYLAKKYGFDMYRCRLDI